MVENPTSTEIYFRELAQRLRHMTIKTIVILCTSHGTRAKERDEKCIAICILLPEEHSEEHLTLITKWKLYSVLQVGKAQNCFK